MTGQAGTVASGGPQPAGPRTGRRAFLGWVGVIPFFGFSFLFLIVPTLYLVVGSFLDKTGAPTVQNYADLLGPQTIRTYMNGIEISAVSALAGCVFGFLMAYAVILGGLPRPLRTALMTFSGVASNFAGVPLAFAFVFTIGRAGLATAILKDVFGVDIYGAGFTIYSKIGLEVVYFYFQLPLMILIIAPAIDGLKKEWREAAENMGATPAEYWRLVALPILLPPLLGSAILLFANAFGAQATAFALTGGSLDIPTIAISRQIRGDVLFNEGLGYALAMGMVVIMAVSIGVYTLLQRRTERWLR